MLIDPDTEEEQLKLLQACVNDILELFYKKKYSKVITAGAMTILLEMLKRDGIELMESANDFIDFMKWQEEN